MNRVPEAMDILRNAMLSDNPSKPGSYAHSWHCNIACMCADAIHDDESEALTSEDAHRIGNEAATRFMKLCFGVETKA